MRLIITFAFVLSFFYVLKVGVITSKQHWNPMATLSKTFADRNFWDFIVFFAKVSAASIYNISWGELCTYLENKNLFHLIYPNVIHGFGLKTLKIFFLANFPYIPESSYFKVFVGIRIVKWKYLKILFIFWNSNELKTIFRQKWYIW